MAVDIQIALLLLAIVVVSAVTWYLVKLKNWFDHYAYDDDEYDHQKDKKEDV